MSNILKSGLKPFIPKTILDNRARWIAKRNYELEVKRQIIIWRENGCPLPPPDAVKQSVVAAFKKKYGYELLIETGTYLGDMVAVQLSKFKQVISIELGVDLHKRAIERFRENKNVSILQGDSGKVLESILPEIHQPAIFWLDGHYSGGITALGDSECPVMEELAAIFDNNRFKHVILIDDERCFTGEGDYPTIDTITQYIKSRDASYEVVVEHDIIRCCC